ncbi:MAG TPA: cation diffusion facilitator family transporter [Gammaproteobacteria bacterium]|nr:cation diffusion facilitator family transporter [Gammaproteobacteria bacterium]
MHEDAIAGTLPDADAKQRVTLSGAAINLLLGVAKVVFGITANSQALIVDGVHSLSDLVSDALVLVGTSIGEKAPDHNHPFGHERFETLATAAVGMLLLAAAGGFAFEAIRELAISGSPPAISAGLAIPVTLASLAAKEGLYWYTRQVGRRAGSRLIEANAWHHRSDALSSLVVLIGLGGVLVGAPWLDAAAALVVAVMLGAMGGSFLWNALSELVDTGLDHATLRELARTIDSVEGVEEHHGLRTRVMAGKVLIEVHIVVDPWISVSEGHRIGEATRTALLDRLHSPGEALVHVDTESSPAPTRAPLRRRVMAELREVWSEIPETRAVARTTLHYRRDGLHVELQLDGGAGLPLDEGLEGRLKHAASQLPYVRGVRILAGASAPHR